jgi:hypothetical protein
VQGSRQFKDFDEYLIPSERFRALREANRSAVAKLFLLDPGRNIIEINGAPQLLKARFEMLSKKWFEFHLTILTS